MLTKNTRTENGLHRTCQQRNQTDMSTMDVGDPCAQQLNDNRAHVWRGENIVGIKPQRHILLDPSLLVGRFVFRALHPSQPSVCVGQPSVCVDFCRWGTGENCDALDGGRHHTTLLPIHTKEIKTRVQLRGCL